MSISIASFGGNIRYVPLSSENRGSFAHPFGFIYLGMKTSSGSVITTDAFGNAYTLGFGASRDEPYRLALWALKDSPHLSLLEIKGVQDYLAATYPETMPSTVDAIVNSDLGFENGVTK